MEINIATVSLTSNCLSVVKAPSFLWGTFIKKGRVEPALNSFKEYKVPSRIIKMGIGRMNQDILDLFDYVSIGDTVTLTLLSEPVNQYDSVIKLKLNNMMTK